MPAKKENAKKQQKGRVRMGARYIFVHVCVCVCECLIFSRFATSKTGFENYTARVLHEISFSSRSTLGEVISECIFRLTHSSTCSAYLHEFMLWARNHFINIIFMSKASAHKLYKFIGEKYGVVCAVCTNNLTNHSLWANEREETERMGKKTLYLPACSRTTLHHNSSKQLNVWWKVFPEQTFTYV